MPSLTRFAEVQVVSTFLLGLGVLTIACNITMQILQATVAYNAWVNVTFCMEQCQLATLYLGSSELTIGGCHDSNSSPVWLSVWLLVLLLVCLFCVHHSCVCP